MGQDYVDFGTKINMNFNEVHSGNTFILEMKQFDWTNIDKTLSYL